MEAAPQENLEAEAAGPHVPIVSLPAEILQNVFSWLNPDDLGPVSRVCRLFRNSIKENQTLCRDIYLLHLVSLPGPSPLSSLGHHGLISNYFLVMALPVDVTDQLADSNSSQDSPPDNAKLNWVRELQDLVRLEKLFRPETDSSEDVSAHQGGGIHMSFI